MYGGLEASVYRDSFRKFIRHFWSAVPGAGKFVHNWHIDLFALELESLACRVKQSLPRAHDLLVNIPFGMSKSMVFSVLFHPWVWAGMPEARFLYATHTDSLALDLAGKAKDVITSAEYQRLFPWVQIRRDKAAKDDYANTLGGERKSCTVGGKTPLGRHAQFIIVDDPIDPLVARSALEIDTAAKFMTEVIPSRMTDKRVTPTVLVQQRLDYRDPSAVMLEVGRREGSVPVRHVCLPGELCPGAAPASPPLEELQAKWPEAYADGLLDPKRLDRVVLATYRAKLGSFAYGGQVLQNPTHREGAMFKPPYFSRRAKSAPREAVRVRYVDRAATAEGGCATAMTLMAKDKDGRLYVEHVKHGHWEPNERNDLIVATAKADRLRYGPKHEPTLVIEAERGSTGLESFQRLAARLIGFKVKEDRPTGSKDVRAEPWADQCACGNVVICDNGQSEGTGIAAWDVQGYIDEHINFRPEPGARLGGLKDRVDSSSGACNWLADKNVGPPEVRVIKFRATDRDKPRYPRFVVSTLEYLSAVDADQRSMLVVLYDPFADPPEYTHALTNLLDTHRSAFMDIDPAAYQNAWEQPIDPHGKPPAELIMTREHGKALWKALLKQQPTPDLFVFASPGGNRADSVAKAVVDVLRIPREGIYYTGSDNVEGRQKLPPTNQHLYDIVKATRGMLL